MRRCRKAKRPWHAILVICPVLLLASCATHDAQPDPETSHGDAYFHNAFPSLPEDARKVVEKLASCNHFAGEFGGDRSTRDREVGAAMTQLHCETIDEDVRLILVRYPGKKALVKALKDATEL